MAPSPPSVNQAVPNTLSSEDLGEALDRLLDGWDAFVRGAQLTARGTGARKGRDRSTTQTEIVLGLVTHIHETARLLRPSMPEQLTVVHMPLVRNVYETTLTAIWCDETDDAANAILNKDGGFRRTLADTLRKSQSGQSFADSVAHQDWRDLETSSQDEATRFYRLTERIALDAAYGYYRILSHYSHPSATVTDQYIAEAGETVRLWATPKPLASFGWSAVVADCLVWAGTVANFYDPTRSRRSELRTIARTLGVPESLPLKYQAKTHRSS